MMKRSLRLLPMNKPARFMASVNIALALMAGPAFADQLGDNAPKFIKGKFDVPVIRRVIQQEWSARGYASPRREVMPQGWHRGEHTHPWNLLIALVSGRMEFTVAGQRFVVEPGDELFYPAQVVISARNFFDDASEMLTSKKW